MVMAGPPERTRGVMDPAGQVGLVQILPQADELRERRAGVEGDALAGPVVVHGDLEGVAGQERGGAGPEAGGGGRGALQQVAGHGDELGGVVGHFWACSHCARRSTCWMKPFLAPTSTPWAPSLHMR